MSTDRVLLGWREWVAVPDLCIPSIRDHFVVGGSNEPVAMAAKGGV